METVAKIDLNSFNVAELEELSRDYRLGLEAKAKNDEEEAIRKERQRRQEILEVGRSYLPVCLGEFLQFDGYDACRHYRPRLMLDCGEWRLLVRIEEKSFDPGWELAKNPYEVLLPGIDIDENGKKFIWWRPSHTAYDQLLEAIGEAMKHEPLSEIQAQVDSYNQGHVQPPAKEPVYVSDSQEPCLMDNLVQLIRDVSLEVYQEQTL